MDAADKYRDAIALYRDTDLRLDEIAGRCGVTRSGLAAYIYRRHRDLMLRRNGVEGDASKPIRANKGQRRETHEKYREAIEACDSEEYLHLNVTQIARLFGLKGPALAGQLRAHYPDVIPRREAERRRRGIADNTPRGVRRTSTETYSEAVKLLRDTDITIEEAAGQCGVSFTGLRQHIIFYHKDLMKLRDGKRQQGKEKPKIGMVAGNGRKREVADEIKRRYAEGVQLYRTTSLPVTEIARRIGVNVSTFRNHLTLWHRNLMFERRGTEPPADAATDRPSLDGTKRYSRATVEKYREAIHLLKTTETTTEAVAKKLGFTPEVFRAYIKEHEPELHDSLGMITLPNGRLVLKRSYEKYREAIEAYTTTSESLKAIAARFGLTYNSLGGFIRRTFPELIPLHRNKC